MKREFKSGQIDEYYVENADQTHFVVNMYNGRTLSFIGDSDIKNSDTVSGGENMTMMVRVTGGANAYFQLDVLIFKYQAQSYPICYLPAIIPGATQ